MHRLINRYNLILWLLVWPGIAVSSLESGSLLPSLERIQQEHQIAGMTVLVVDRKKILLLRSLGVTDHKTQEPLTPRHYIRLGSVSKLFLGLTAISLAREGKIELDAPLDTRIENFPMDNPWVTTHPVTLAALLEHTAGITDMSRPEWDSAQPLPLKAAFEVDPASRLLHWPAGLHSSYSNSGAGVAAYVMQSVTGTDWRQLVQRHVFDSVQLMSATYDLSDEVTESLITGYDTDGHTRIPYWHMLYPAFGGINIRSEEMAQLLQLFLNQGKQKSRVVFQPADVRRMSTATTTIAARNGLEYGYGLGLYHYQHNSFPFIGHGGDADGYLTHFSFSDFLGRGYFVVINAFNNKAMRQIRRRIENELTAEQTPPAKPNRHVLTEIQKAKIIGEYVEVTRRFVGDRSLEVFQRDNRLYTNVGSQTLELIAVSPTHFRRPNQSVATMVIVSERGATFFQGDAGNFRKLPGENRIAPSEVPKP